MKTTNDGNAVPRHLDDDDLISYLDGELSRGEQESARTHLAGCWNCRSRLLAVQNSIESFLRLRKQVLPTDIPPSGAAVAQFRRRLSQHASAPVSLRLRLPQWLRPSHWRNLIPDFSLISRHRKTALATGLASVVLIALLIDPLGLSRVSADELLTRAGSYEFLNESPGGKVVRARVRLDRIALSTHLETRIGEVETAEDSLTSSVYVFAQHASGAIDKTTTPDRDKSQAINFFASDFPQATANYLTAQNYFPQVTVRAYRRLIAARGFTGNDGASVARRGDIYELHHPFSSAHPSGINETVLLVNAQSYAPQAISIFATDGSEQFEYRLTRTSFEKVERTTEMAQLFEPSKSEAALNATPDTRHRSPDIPSEPETGNPKPESATASADLEVEVLRLLHQAGADLGEQVSVIRDANGPVRVSGIVETDHRKSEILRALQPVADNLAVRIEVRTVAEAMAERRGKSDVSRPTTVEGIEVAADTFPAYQDLRASMSDEEARVFAARIVSRSHSAMRHAWALKRLMSQFSANDLATLQPEAHAKWIALIKSHARAFENESRSLREQLQTVFGSGVGTGAGAEISNDGELIRAIERLVALASTNYQVVRSAFTVTRESSSVSAIKTPQFWQSLRSAEALASSIQRTH